jgi:hypothetical protein
MKLRMNPLSTELFVMSANFIIRLRRFMKPVPMW